MVAWGEQAGAALVFDMATWHTATANVSTADRCTVIVRWLSSLVGQTPLLDPAITDRLAERGRLTPTLRQLVGA